MRQISDDLKEIFEVVDKTGKVIGQAKREECHQGKNFIHRAVHLYVFNKEGMVMLQKRSQTKDISPGCWTASASGHLMVAENFEKAVKREAKEELGIILKQKDLKWRPRKAPGEIWLMYKDVKKQSEGNIRKIISAWRYPGISKPGEAIPIPEDIKIFLKSGTID